MARVADIDEAALRGNLEEAERLLDADRYREAVELCADTYLRVMEQHPELVPPPGASGFGITFGFGGRGPGAGGPGGARPVGVWPVGLGLRIDFDEDKQPELTFEKDHFNFSEAVTYFEFTLDLAVRAQRS